ncbi:MAG: hypothetical protein J5794_01590, partial [Lachnospiraceae bacterium]|nr:hypothetical protein [Lachnospiraceae bacterium]
SALWGRLFVKDARPFAESLFANSFAYYAMVPRLDPNPLGTKYNGNPGERDWFYINTDADAGREILQVAYPENTAPLRTALERWCAVWRRLPGLNLLTDCGTYTWILILLWIIATKQKKGFLFLGMALPPVLMVFVCIASPVNDCMRYYFSIPATIFTCIAACGSLIRNEDPAPDAHSKTIPDPSGSAMKTPQTPAGPAQKCPDDR